MKCILIYRTVRLSLKDLSTFNLPKYYWKLFLSMRSWIFWSGGKRQLLGRWRMYLWSGHLSSSVWMQEYYWFLWLSLYCRTRTTNRRNWWPGRESRFFGKENRVFDWTSIQTWFYCGDIDECQTELNSCDLDFETCINTQGSYQCFCKTGYRKDQGWEKRVEIYYVQYFEFRQNYFSVQLEPFWC